MNEGIFEIIRQLLKNPLTVGSAVVLVTLIIVNVLYQGGVERLENSYRAGLESLEQSHASTISAMERGAQLERDSLKSQVSEAQRRAEEMTERGHACDSRYEAMISMILRQAIDPGDIGILQVLVGSENIITGD